MDRLKLLIPILFLVAILIWAVPEILKAMPDRYVARLPEPLQKLGLPEEQAALLPTVSSPAAANTLLLPEITKNENSSTNFPGPASTEEPTQTINQIEVTVQNGTLEPTPDVTPIPTEAPSPTPWLLPASARINGFQHKFQEWNNCGPATLAMALTYFGMDINQQDTALVLKPNPEDRNVSPQEMSAYVNEQTPYQSISRVNGDLNTLRRLVANDIPVIIEIGIDPPGEFRWLGWYGHYLLVVAYDDNAEQFWVYDSWFGTSEEPLQNAHPDGRVLKYEDLETYWSQFNHNYIMLFRPDQFELVQTIVGEDMNDQIMWENTLARSQEDVTGDPKNAFHWFNLGTSYNALGQYSEAATAYDQARAIGLPWRMLWYQFGPFEAYLEAGRYADVILLADVTLKDRPYFEESYYYKGLALAATSDLQGAQENFQLAADFNPGFLPALEALGQ